jgi:hypothetical protein
MEVSSTEEKQVAEEKESGEQALSDQEIEAGRLALRENAKRVLRDSGLAQMLQEINKNELRRRGIFEEYDSLLLLKWGTGYTRRHIWIEVKGNTIRFRLSPHRKCSSSAPVCDGEYHTFTGQMWANSDLLRLELYKYYRIPVAESSDD